MILGYILESKGERERERERESKKSREMCIEGYSTQADGEDLFTCPRKTLPLNVHFCCCIGTRLIG